MGGLTKLAVAGYDTREAAAVWSQLRAEMDATAAARNTKSQKDKGKGIFATHPPSAERLTYLIEEAAKAPGVVGATGVEAYRTAMADWWPAFVDDQLKLNDFGAGEYLLASMASQGWTPWLLYARGELYRRRASEGDMAKASTYFDEAIAKGGVLPELWRGRGLARIKLGDVEPGRADLKEYLRRAPTASDRAMINMVSGGLQ